jgi:hypothetical protein
MPGTEKQRKAAGAALGAKRKGSAKGLYGAAKQMAQSMTEQQLVDFATKKDGRGGNMRRKHYAKHRKETSRANG